MQTAHPITHRLTCITEQKIDESKLGDVLTVETSRIIMGPILKDFYPKCHTNQIQNEIANRCFHTLDEYKFKLENIIRTTFERTYEHPNDLDTPGGWIRYVSRIVDPIIISLRTEIHSLSTTIAVYKNKLLTNLITKTLSEDTTYAAGLNLEFASQIVSYILDRTWKQKYNDAIDHQCWKIQALLWGKLARLRLGSTPTRPSLHRV